MTRFEFDPNGNQIRKSAPAGVTQFVWNLDNRLTELTLPSGLVNRMAYAPDGLRTHLEDTDGVHDILLDGIEELAEYDATGAQRLAWTHSPARVDEILSQVSSQGKGFFQGDALGSIVGLSEGSGQLARAVRYDAYGGVSAGTGTFGTPWGFTGRRIASSEVDNISYHRARYLSLATGAFLSGDPVDRYGYGYAAANPIRFADPFGLVATAITLVGIRLEAAVIATAAAPRGPSVVISILTILFTLALVAAAGVVLIVSTRPAGPPCGEVAS